MKQFPIIINTEQGNYPITLTCHSHSFSNIKEVDPKSIEKYISKLSQLKNILQYYKVKEVNLLYTSNQIIWIILFNLNEDYDFEGVTITENMAYNFNKDLEIFMDGGYPNIGIQTFEAGFNLLDPLTITVCYDHQ
mgnify:CR=1 FL=1